jgi:hypothetical protein
VLRAHIYTACVLIDVVQLAVQHHESKKAECTRCY